MDFKKRLKNKRRQFEEQLQEFRNSEAEKVASAKEEKVQGGPSKDSSDLLKNKSLGCLTAAEEKLRSKNEQEPPTLKKSFEEEAANHEATQEINNVNGHLKNLKKANAVLEKTKQTPEVENTDLIPEFQNVNPSRQENDDHKKQAGSQLSKIQVKNINKRPVIDCERKMLDPNAELEAIKENSSELSRIKAYCEQINKMKNAVEMKLHEKGSLLLFHFRKLDEVGGEIKVLKEKQNTLQNELSELVNSYGDAIRNVCELGKIKQFWEIRLKETKYYNVDIFRMTLLLRYIIENNIRTRSHLHVVKQRELMNTNKAFEDQLAIENELRLEILNVIRDYYNAEYEVNNLKEQIKIFERKIQDLEIKIIKSSDNLYISERAKGAAESKRDKQLE